MSYLGPPNRGNDPLHVWAMALALAAAAALGAGLGFLIDFASDQPAGESAAQPEP